MQFDIRISVIVILAVTAAVYGAFKMPPLTSAGGSGSSGANQAVFEAAVTREFSHCVANRPDTNCACFANRSGLIMTNKAEQVIGVTYADRQQLARDQADMAC